MICRLPDQTRRHRDEFDDLVVESVDLGVAVVRKVTPLLLDVADVAGFALADLFVHGVVRRVDRVLEMEPKQSDRI